MPKELIDEGFKQSLNKLSSITSVSETLEVQLRIFFQEGFICASEFFIEKLQKNTELLQQLSEKIAKTPE